MFYPVYELLTKKCINTCRAFGQSVDSLVVLASILATEVIRQQTAKGRLTLIPDTEWMTSRHWTEYLLSRENIWKQRVFVVSTYRTGHDVILEQVDAAHELGQIYTYTHIYIYTRTHARTHTRTRTRTRTHTHTRTRTHTHARTHAHIHEHT